MSTKRKLPSKLIAPTVKTSAKPTKTSLNDAHAVISAGGAVTVNGVQEVETIEISSDHSSSDSEEDDDAATPTAQDTEMGEAGADDDEAADAEPSFGDLVHAHSHPIDVASAFPSAPTATALTQTNLPPGASLSTVLTQALKTNDSVLLETCLQTTNLPTIRSTIQRLSPSLASNLLSLLAARLHRRPGRAGSLMVWIQWTLVTHGGFLATQPQLIKELSDLQRVLEQRARGLNGLLGLKGRLDLLEAQMMVRRGMRERNGSEESDEENVVYVEGEEESDSEAEVQVNGLKSKASRKAKVQQEDSDDDISVDDMPTTLGEGEEEEEDSDDDSEGMIDDEAEETDNDSGDDEEEIDYDDVDDLGEEEEESDDQGMATPAAVGRRTPKAPKLKR
jgi:U3 small nucleolar RNA-associated protein 5